MQYVNIDVSSLSSEATPFRNARAKFVLSHQDELRCVRKQMLKHLKAKHPFVEAKA